MQPQTRDLFESVRGPHAHHWVVHAEASDERREQGGIPKDAPDDDGASAQGATIWPCQEVQDIKRRHEGQKAWD
jgi:hypothetical protein